MENPNYKFRDMSFVEKGDLVLCTESSRSFTKGNVYVVAKPIPKAGMLSVVQDDFSNANGKHKNNFRLLETKPIDDVQVGDYMYRTHGGTPAFPSRTVIEVMSVRNTTPYYASSSSPCLSEIIIISTHKNQNMKHLPIKQPKIKGKYLSLKIKNKQANVKELIFQSFYTNIRDPRPYINDLILQEKVELLEKIKRTDLTLVNYGYNIKLARLLRSVKQLTVVEEASELSLASCITIYTFFDELAEYTAQTTSVATCPYSWIAEYLVSDILDVPATKTLFTSNKYTIYIKDGSIYLDDFRTNNLYSADIKLDVNTNTYTI